MGRLYIPATISPGAALFLGLVGEMWAKGSCVTSGRNIKSQFAVYHASFFTLQKKNTAADRGYSIIPKGSENNEQSWS